MVLATREGLVMPRTLDTAYGKIWPIARQPASTANTVLIHTPASVTHSLGVERRMTWRNHDLGVLSTSHFTV